jgi:hypothetical protein
MPLVLIIYRLRVRKAARSAEASGIGGAATLGAGPENRLWRSRGRNHRIARPRPESARRYRGRGDALKKRGADAFDMDGLGEIAILKA